MEESYDERADELEKEADFTETKRDDVEKLTKETREDWESKKSSPQSPGALDHEDAMPGGADLDEDE
jgi:hypothetical protein